MNNKMSQWLFYFPVHAWRLLRKERPEMWDFFDPVLQSVISMFRLSGMNDNIKALHLDPPAKRDGFRDDGGFPLAMAANDIDRSFENF